VGRSSGVVSLELWLVEVACRRLYCRLEQLEVRQLRHIVEEVGHHIVEEVHHLEGRLEGRRGRETVLDLDQKDRPTKDKMSVTVFS
jgi:hypothetical protein